MSQVVLLTSAMVARRYSVSKRTIARWSAALDLEFPQRVTINGRPYWRLSDLIRWEDGDVELPTTKNASN
jgi:hypothetical protein